MLKFLSPTLMNVAHIGYCDPAGDGTGGGSGGGDGTNKTGGEGGAGAAGGAGGDGKNDPPLDPLTTDIKAAIEKARAQEKSKLYGQIEESKKAAKLAEELAAARDAENKAMKQRVAELEAKLKGNGGEGGEGEGDEASKKGKKATLSQELLDKAIDAAVNTTAQRLEEKFKAELEAARAKIEELEKGNQHKDLNAYREQLISSNKDYIVPELVTGNTRDELDQSLVLAKQVFARVSQGVKQKKGGEDEGGGDGDAPQNHTLVLPPTPPINGNGAPGAPVAVDVRKLGSTDYQKSRQELLKAAAAQARKMLADS